MQGITELYQELCTIAQKGKETPQEFIFCALELRQKILFTDKENMVKYDQNLATAQFNLAIKTGLRDNDIRIELRSVISGYKSDEELLKGVNDITRRQTERERKPAGVKSKTEVMHVMAAPEDPVLHSNHCVLMLAS